MIRKNCIPRQNGFALLINKVSLGQYLSLRKKRIVLPTKVILTKALKPTHYADHSPKRYQVTMTIRACLLGFSPYRDPGVIMRERPSYSLLLVSPSCYRLTIAFLARLLRIRFKVFM